MPHTDRYLRAAWFGDEAISYEPSDTWTDEMLDWNTKADLERPRELRKSDGWITIREGAASGPLMGGCLETICWHLRRSATWLDPAGAIVFLEMSEEAPSPAHVDSYLTDLEQLGVFDAAAGLVLARPCGYTLENTKSLWDVVARRTEASGLPALANIAAGHSDPMVTLPLGVAAELDAGSKRFRLLEAPTVANI